MTSSTCVYKEVQSSTALYMRYYPMTAQHYWGYGEENGPSTWGATWQAGNHQSPIDIDPRAAEYDAYLKPIVLSYDKCSSKRIENDGHSVLVDFEDKDDRSVIEDGPLEHAYRLKQFHFHWGEKGGQGSEHAVAGKRYPSELHVVHWNSVKYKSYEDARASTDGLAILCIFVETGDDRRVPQDNGGLRTITDALYMVKYKGRAVDFKGFNLSCLLPSSLHYWTYAGSLTTPPLSESVTWMILKEPILVPEKQVDKFRQLHFNKEEEDKKPMKNNFRPLQPLNDRMVYASFN